MRVAIIAGTDIYHIPGLHLQAETIQTPYGPALVHRGQGSNDHWVFLTRHGPDHTTPPHKVNYRANIKALEMLHVKAAIAAYAVGSINPEIPPRALVLLDDFMDFTSDRPLSFYDGDGSGLAHTIMSPPYCPTLRDKLLGLAEECDISLRSTGTYVCTNGPRFETPAEIRMYSKLGGDVVGMTGAQEAILARELGIHFAAVGLSINWAAGIEPTINIIHEGQKETRQGLLDLFLKTLSPPLTFACSCAQAVLFTHHPQPHPRSSSSA